MARREADLPADGQVPEPLAGPRRRLEAVPRRRRAILYLRQSLKKEESISLEVQEEIDRAYCARKGYDVIKVIADQKTGQKWEKRKGIQEVMGLVLAGEADVVVLYRWSRISRVRLHQAQAIHAIEQVGVEVESATEPFDTKTAAGEFGRDMMLDLAVFQGKLIGEQWTEVHNRRREDGLPHCGGRRYGYHYEKGRYTVNPDQVEVDRWRYAEYLSGAGFRAIAAELNRRGHLNVHGRPWNDTSLAETMDSGFSAGLICQGSAERKRTYIRGQHQPILDDERAGPTWRAYLAMRKKRATIPPRVIEPTYPLTGLVRCGALDCGAALRICSKKEPGKASIPGYYYRCLNRLVPGVGAAVGITRAALEAEVRAWVGKIATDIDTGVAAHEETTRTLAKAALDVEAATRAVAKIDKMLTRLALQHAAEDDVVPESVYLAGRDELLAQRKDAQSALDTARHAADIPAGPPRKLAAALVADWPILSVRERRGMLAQLIRVVIVHPAADDDSKATVEIVPVWAPLTSENS